MPDRHSPIRYTRFAETEFAALQALRTRYESTSHQFTERELAHLHFLRWLIHRPAWRLAAKQPVPAEETRMSPSSEPAMDAWMDRLKSAHEAGYYRTESGEDAQIPFPWQNKTCGDCPYWSAGICQVLAEYRWSTAHTCRYFDSHNRVEAERMIQDRRWQGFRRWWAWFNGRGVAE